MGTMVCMKRVSIIVDDDVAYRVVKEIQELGASGYTRYAVQGYGERGMRPRHAVSGNAKIEVVTDAAVAQRILEHMAGSYFEKYAAIAYVESVEVLRSEKFGAMGRETAKSN